MCSKRGASVLAKTEAGPGKSQTFGGAHPQERAAKEGAGVFTRWAIISTQVSCLCKKNITSNFL